MPNQGPLIGVDITEHVSRSLGEHLKLDALQQYASDGQGASQTLRQKWPQMPIGPQGVKQRKKTTLQDDEDLPCPAITFAWRAFGEGQFYYGGGYDLRLLWEIHAYAGDSLQTRDQLAGWLWHYFRPPSGIRQLDIWEYTASGSVITKSDEVIAYMRCRRPRMIPRETLDLARGEQGHVILNFDAEITLVSGVGSY